VPIVTLETSGADSSSPHGGSAGDFNSDKVRLLGTARGCVGGVIGFCSLSARGKVVARFFRRLRRDIKIGGVLEVLFYPPFCVRNQSLLNVAMLTGRKGRHPEFGEGQ
jgi:hypothetical protein